MSEASNWHGTIQGLSGESDDISKAERIGREKVENEPKSVILRPQDLTGNYDASRVLMTTIGGSLREITANDLIAFSKNAETVKNRYTKGITAKQVIDFAKSDPKIYTGNNEWKGFSDVDKAKAEITHAIPHSVHKGLIRFITPSASVKGGRHHVNVRMLGWEAGVASPIVNKTTGQADWRKTALWVARQPLRFDCDCGRHKFWFRYIATIGQYNEGRDERGFPKIRNPHLKGVACKHVLRVMSDIQLSHSSFILLIMKQLEKEHGATTGTVSKRVTPTRVSQKDADKLASGKGRSVIGREAKTKLAKDITENVKVSKKTAKSKLLESAMKNESERQILEQAAKIVGMSIDDFLLSLGGK